MQFFENVTLEINYCNKIAYTHIHYTQVNIIITEKY